MHVHRWTGSNGGIDWALELDSADLIPGRLVRGRVTLVARRAVTGRGVVVTLRGEERWKYEVTTNDGQTTTTTVHTGTAELPPNPVRVAGPLSLALSETVAPPLAPPTTPPR